jgi:hypothetical protein
LIINIVCLTSRLTRINYQNYLNEKKKKNVILAFWHGRQFLLVFDRRFKDTHIMTSLSRDGDLQTKILSKFGHILIRGSAGKRGAVEATLEFIKILKQDHDAAFAVDGPTGPARKVKPGVLYLAQKTGCKIVPFSSSAKHNKTFNNWDKYMFPYPFNKCVITFGTPVEVKKEVDLELKAIELEEELNRITDLADSLVN